MKTLMVLIQLIGGFLIGVGIRHIDIPVYVGFPLVLISALIWSVFIVWISEKIGCYNEKAD